MNEISLSLYSLSAIRALRFGIFLSKIAKIHNAKNDTSKGITGTSVADWIRCSVYGPGFNFSREPVYRCFTQGTLMKQLALLKTSRVYCTQHIHHSILSLKA